MVNNCIKHRQCHVGWSASICGLHLLLHVPASRRAMAAHGEGAWHMASASDAIRFPRALRSGPQPPV